MSELTPDLSAAYIDKQMRSILAICLNPCLDISVGLPDAVELAVGELNRYERLRAVAGGKGLNVARLLSEQGWDSSTFLALPAVSRGIQSYFEMERYGACVYQVPGELRINLKVHEHQPGGRARMTEFNGSGDPIDDETAQNLVGMLMNAAASSNVIVLSGRLLPGIPENIYARLAAVSRKSNGISVLDASETPMRLAVEGRVDIFKPNRDELRQLTGLPCLSVAESADAAAAYCRSGRCQLILASLGLDGAVLTNGYQTYHSPVPNPDEPIVSLTGAGDSMTAVLAGFAATAPLRQSFTEFQRTQDLSRLLRVAMATAQANVRLHSSEPPTLAQVNEWLSRVEVKTR